MLSVPAWIGIIYFERPILTFFGADESLLTLAQSYMYPIKLVFPLFLFNQMLAAFLRNDKNPGLATIGVLSGVIFNIFGDYFFVFTCDMGIFGAGHATAIGACVSFFVILTHFVSKKNTLRLVKPKRLFVKLYEICITGFSTFFIDVAMGILTVLSSVIFITTQPKKLRLYWTNTIWNAFRYIILRWLLQRKVSVRLIILKLSVQSILHQENGTRQNWQVHLSGTIPSAFTLRLRNY